VSRTRSRGRHRHPGKHGSAVLPANDLAADPGTWIRATPVAFYGRTAHAAGMRDGQAERYRQLAQCRAIVAACGGRLTALYFDESCRADHPWSRRPQGQALLTALSGPAPAWTLVTADAGCLLPRRASADGTGILRQLAQRQVLLLLADTGAAALTAREYELLGRIMSGIAGGEPVARLAAAPSGPLPSAVPHAWQPRGGEPG
jgi:hypothetical protein